MTRVELLVDDVVGCEVELLVLLVVGDDVDVEVLGLLEVEDDVDDEVECWCYSRSRTTWRWSCWWTRGRL